MLGVYSAMLAWGSSLLTIMLAMCALLLTGLMPLFMRKNAH